MNIDTVVLLEVLKAKTDELSDAFIRYDTETTDGKYYNLPTGPVLVLIIMASSGIFTTIRRWTPQKEQYYRSLRGKEFVIELLSKNV